MTDSSILKYILNTLDVIIGTYDLVIPSFVGALEISINTKINRSYSKLHEFLLSCKLTYVKYHNVLCLDVSAGF